MSGKWYRERERERERENLSKLVVLLAKKNATVSNVEREKSGGFLAEMNAPVIGMERQRENLSKVVVLLAKMNAQVRGM